MRPRSRERPLRHLEEGKSGVPAVADEMHVLRVGKQRFEQRQVAHVHRRLVAPARLPHGRCIRLVDRRDGGSGRHAGSQPRRDVLQCDTPVADRRDAAQIVEKPARLDGPPMAPGQQRDEERLVGNRDPGRAVEDDAQQRRPRPAHAEEDQRGRRHSGGAVTTTSERAARSPTVTKSEYVRGSSGARSTSTCRVPTPRCPANSHRYERASVRTRTEKRFPAPTSIRSRDSSTIADAHRHGASPRRSVPGPVDGAQPDLVRSRRHPRSVDPAEPDEPPLQ